MEAIAPEGACMLGGDEALLRSLQRSQRTRLFASIVDDIDRALRHFGAELIDEGTLVGVLRDRLAALEQLAQGQVTS